MRNYLFCMILTVVLMVLVGQAPGADIYVATNGNHGAATNWATAYTNIQTALDAAATNEVIETIYVAGHTFLITNQLNWTNCSGVTILGGYAATNDAGPGEYDAELWPTVIARSSGNIRIMSVNGVTNSLLKRVTITKGYVSGSQGGGLYIKDCQGLTISSCVITNNLATDINSYGLGVYSEASEVTLTNCLVGGNQFSGARLRGGGICVQSGTMTIIDSIISNNRGTENTSDGNGGGGIRNTGTTVMRNCLVYGNYTSVSPGDGIYSSGSISLENCTVANNHGEGIYCAGGGAAATNCIFWCNVDDIAGTVTLAYCDIEDGDNNETNGCISADPLFVYESYLATNSPCVDAGTNTAAFWGLGGHTTRMDGTNDSDIVDMGYHYKTGCGFMYLPDLYVAENGTNTNSGTNWAEAFRTIGKALSVAMNRTRIHVGLGNYTNGLETFPLSVADKIGLQLLGTNRATTVINASGSNQRVMNKENSSNAKLANLTITGGYGSEMHGGGLHIQYCQDLTISACAITNNRVNAVNSYGLGIYSVASEVTLTNCLVNGNWASGQRLRGGGICVWSGTMTIVDSIISNNRGTETTSDGNGGGGIWIWNTGTTVMRNCLVYGNYTSVSPGDGIYSSGSISLENCTVANNPGEGIYHGGGTASATNCIFWGNVDDIYGTVTLAYSDIEDGDNNTTNGCIKLDPVFVDTNAANYRLEKSSPCINKGINLAWMIGAGDLDGNPRINSKTVDMGAYEVQLPPAGTMFMCQ